jgi:25S rRNA (uracil2634-N3)-methyltransferase
MSEEVADPELLHDLYIHEVTFRCATKEQCIPCFYKIYPLWKSKLHPNQRPETCPRSRSRGEDQGQGLYSYSREKIILTVGDGDFSFSLSLSTDLRQEKRHAVNLIATSYESGESVRSVYPTARENIHLLTSRGVPVLHDVDSTKLELVPLLSQGYQHGIDLIVWNFPCKRAEFGADAQVDDIEENRELIRGFFQSAQRFLKSEHSEIHVTHKTLEPFCWWNIVEIARECGLRCEGSIVFDRYLYPGYINRKALDKKSFPFHDARVSSSSPPSHEFLDRHSYSLKEMKPPLLC